MPSQPVNKCIICGKYGFNCELVLIFGEIMSENYVIKHICTNFALVFHGNSF